MKKKFAYGFVCVLLVFLTACTVTKGKNEPYKINQKLADDILEKTNKINNIKLTELFIFEWDTVAISQTQTELEKITGKTFERYTMETISLKDISENLVYKNDYIYRIDESAYKRLTFFKNDKLVCDFWYSDIKLSFGSYKNLIASDDCDFAIENKEGRKCFYFVKDGIKQNYDDYNVIMSSTN